MGKPVPLGKPLPVRGVAESVEPTTIEEKFAILQYQIDQLAEQVNAVSRQRYEDSRTRTNAGQENGKNKDGLEFGTTLLGYSKRGGMHVLDVCPDGYYIGARKFDSLSAAAEAASGMRRSGWVYWTYPDGRTVKEVLGKE